MPEVIRGYVSPGREVIYCLPGHIILPYPLGLKTRTMILQLKQGNLSRPVNPSATGNTGATGYTSAPLFKGIEKAATNMEGQ